MINKEQDETISYLRDRVEFVEERLDDIFDRIHFLENFLFGLGQSQLHKGGMEPPQGLKELFGTDFIEKSWIFKLSGELYLVRSYLEAITGVSTKTTEERLKQVEELEKLGAPSDLLNDIRKAIPLE